MDPRIIKKAEENIKSVERDASAEVAAALRQVLQNAIRGDDCAQIIITEMTTSFEMDAHQKAFLLNIDACMQNHASYQDKLTELKQLYWGKPVLFAKALEKLHNEYEHDYREARKSREGFKKCTDEFVRSSKKFQKACLVRGINLSEEYKPQEHFKDLTPKFACNEQITREDVMLREQKEAMSDVESMDKMLNTVRADMYADFGMGRLAVDVINDLAQRESQNTQQAKN